MTALLPVPDVSGLDVVFGSDALSWMPAWEDIPDEYRNMNALTEQNKIVQQWFFRGLNPKVKFVPNPGVDKEKALAAIKATLGSYEPKHEHKEAAVAYMLASWFTVKGWKQ